MFHRLFEERPDDEGLPGPQRRLAYVALLMAAFVSVVDSTIVVLALPTIARDFAISAAASVWAINGFLIASAASLLAFSGLGSKFGYRTLFIVGMATFTLASLICGVAQDFNVLVAGRILQGIGSAAVMSVGSAIFRLLFPLRLIGSVVGFSSMVVATGTAIGPALGGLILSVADWHWIFLINLPLGVFVCWLATYAMPRDSGHGSDYDFLGALLSGVALGAMVMAVDRLAHNQVAASSALLCLLMLASGGGFLVRQRYAARPLVPPGIFRIHRFRSAAMTSVASFAAQGISFTALPFLLQETQQQGLLASGLLFAVWPLTIMIAGPFAGRLSDRYHAPTLATMGLAVLMIGLALVASAGSTGTWGIAWRVAICGLGFGFFQAPNGRELNTSVGREWIGAASGIIATARTMGQALGAALAAVALGATQLGSSSSTGTPVTAVWIGAAIAFVATLISGSRIRQQSAQA